MFGGEGQATVLSKAHAMGSEMEVGEDGFVNKGFTSQQDWPEHPLARIKTLGIGRRTPYTLSPGLVALIHHNDPSGRRAIHFTTSIAETFVLDYLKKYEAMTKVRIPAIQGNRHRHLLPLWMLN